MLYSRVKHGVAYVSEQSERRLERHRFDTITEGIGIDRVVANFEAGEQYTPLFIPIETPTKGTGGCHQMTQSRRRLRYIDDALRVSDQEAVEMAHWLLKKDGLFVGSSSAVNCCAAVKVARQLGPGHTVVTLLCDGGQRHTSKFFCPEYLAKFGLSPKASGLEFLGDGGGTELRGAAALQSDGPPARTAAEGDVPRNAVVTTPASEASASSVDFTIAEEEGVLLQEQLSRNASFFGEKGHAKIREAFVVVVGLGGVGSHAANMLSRCRHPNTHNTHTYI